MDASYVLLMFGGFAAGVLVLARVGAWVAGLVALFKAPLAERRWASVAVQLFLHSGPWFLAFAIGAVYYVASLSRPAWLWAVLCGFGLAVPVLVAVVAMARLRQDRGQETTSMPFAPERLRKVRRRFFWWTSVCFGGSLAAFFFYQLWSQIGGNVAFVAFVLGACLAGGYVFSWFMWQLYSASLLARDEACRSSERNSAV